MPARARQIGVLVFETRSRSAQASARHGSAEAFVEPAKPVYSLESAEA